MKKPGTFQIMQEEHQSLQNIVFMVQTSLEALVRGDSGPDQEVELIFLLNYLKMRLAFHFNIEETIGTLNDIKKTNSHLYGELTAIVRDHRELIIRLEGIIKYMNSHDLGETGIIDVLSEKLVAFFNHLRYHEEKETALVLNAANTGMGKPDGMPLSGMKINRQESAL